MNVRIDFNVGAVTLPEGVRSARNRLADFLGPDDDIESWHITLNCSPAMETGVGDVLSWSIDVEAVRGTRFGP